MAGGSDGQSRFLEALSKTQAKRDGGFANNWSFNQAEDDSDGDAERDVANLLSVGESDGSDSPNEEPESKQLRPEALRGESLKTYEKRTRFVTFRPLKGNAIGLNMLGASKKLGDNAQNVAVTPGTVLHGRRFHHANSLVTVVKTAAQRKEYPPHVQKMEAGHTRVPRPHGAENVSESKAESDEESECEIRRKVQQKRRCESYSADLLRSSAPKMCPNRLDVGQKKPGSEQFQYLTFCPDCGKESESQTKCQSCSELQRHSRQTKASESSGHLSRPSIHQNAAAQKSSIGINATNFYGAAVVNVPVDILLDRALGRELLPTNGKVGLVDGANGPKNARTIRLRGVRPPEMNDPIVLSSDEEEEDNSCTGSTSRVESTSPRPADSACSSPAPSSGKVEAAFKENNSKVEQRLSGSGAADMEHTVTLPRKARMRDQFGNAVANIPVKRRKVTQETSPKAPFDSVILNCRSIRIGTLSRMVVDPVIFGLDSIKIRIEGTESDSQEINLKTSELTKCDWCNARLLAMVYLQTTPAACHSLRTQLNMSREKDNVWYDCKGTNPEEQYIVLIFETALDNHASAVFEKVISDIGVRNKITDLVSVLEFEEANARLVSVTKNHEEILMRSLTPKDNKIKNVALESRMLSRNTSSPLQFFDDDDVGESHSVFIGPIVKLIVYPPPPAKGGISVTNEDLHCLNEGEFLNDVIIDFYLKYLVLEKLRKDAHRIHVFSSFFYKRLNQRERRNLQETANLSIQQRRHGRVKTWTRHVDIFQKDFIFVPLNEAAHWFLAVICFPGLEESKYEPNPLYQGNVNSQSPVCVAEEDTSNTSQSDSDVCLKSPVTKPAGKKTPNKKLLVGSSDTNTGNEDNDTQGARRSPCRGKRGLKNGEEDNSEVEETEKKQSQKADFRTTGPNDIQSECKTPVKPIDRVSQISRIQNYRRPVGRLLQPQLLRCFSRDALSSIRISYSDDAAEGKEDEFIDSSEDQDNLDESSDEGGQADESFTSESGKWHLKPSICKQPCILIMDSLRGPSRSNVVKTLREYLEVEWEVRKGSKRSFSKEAMKGSNPRVPQQNNFSDCGVYVLQYVESFFENPIQNFELPMNLSDWFPQQRMKTKREEIRNLILNLQEHQNKEKKGQKDFSSTAQAPIQEGTEQLIRHSSTD